MSTDHSDRGPRTRSKVKKDEERKRQRRQVSSSDDDGNGSGSGNDSEGGEEIDIQEYRKLLGKMFPSKHMDNKIRAGEKVKKSSNKKKGKRQEEAVPEEVEGEGEDEDEVEDEDEDDEEWCEGDSEYSDGSELDSEEEEELSNALSNAQFNIIFTMGGAENSEDEDEYDDEDEDEDEDEEEEEEAETMHIEESKRKKKNQHQHQRKRSRKDKGRSSESESETTTHKKTKREVTTNPEETDEQEAAVVAKLKKVFEGLTAEEKSSGLVKDLLAEYENIREAREKERKRRDRKTKTKNAASFKKLLRDKSVMNDMRFFKDHLKPSEQSKVLSRMKEIRDHCDVVKPYRLALLDSDIPVQYKACAYKKITTLKYMEPGGGEYYKMKNWVDAFMRIPFGVHRSLPLTLDAGVEKCHEFMENAKKTLDSAVYGLNDAKLQIMQMVGQWIANPHALGTAIAIKGPMGTGKTTLVKEGISKILGREFSFIALGGATDSSFLEGHSYTYEGSTWGKIVEILLQSRSMNPVIYFDELDKVSETPKGEEITGILTHLTDTTQNSKFHDKYFSEIDFDLSRCLFIFSYNDESRINPILRDRMYRIQTKGYSEKEKVTIARDYLLPKIREQVKFKEEEIVIPDETITYLISKHTSEEQGVRNLKRCLEILHTKLNLYRLMKPGTNLFKKDMELEVTFPFTVTREVADVLIRSEKKTGAWLNMYS